MLQPIFYLFSLYFLNYHIVKLTFFICTGLWILTRVDLCNSTIIEQLYHPKNVLESLSSHIFPSRLTPGNHWSILCHYSFVFSSVSFKENHTVYNLLLRLASIGNSALMPLRFIQVVCVSILFLFYCWVVVHCMDVPQFVYPFIYWRTFRLFPVWDNYE